MVRVVAGDSLFLNEPDEVSLRDDLHPPSNQWVEAVGEVVETKTNSQKQQSTFQVDISRMLSKSGARQSSLAEELAVLDKDRTGSISEAQLLEYMRKKTNGAITTKYLAYAVVGLIFFTVLLIGLNATLMWYITDQAKDTSVDSDSGVLQVRNFGDSESKAVSVNLVPDRDVAFKQDSPLSSLWGDELLDTLDFITFDAKQSTETTDEDDEVDLYKTKLPVESWFRMPGFGDSGVYVVIILKRSGFVVMDGEEMVVVTKTDFPSIDVMQALNAVDLSGNAQEKLDELAHILLEIDMQLLPEHASEDEKSKMILQPENRPFTYALDINESNEGRRRLLWNCGRRRSLLSTGRHLTMQGKRVKVTVWNRRSMPFFVQQMYFQKCLGNARCSIWCQTAYG
mmetsp:Transcript_10917/g.12843  ORF Transcript_10917/g.12843 Transcript_10917/m.12843 type:complete len:397 (-) Transcript_10917:149-1339(-)